MKKPVKLAILALALVAAAVSVVFAVTAPIPLALTTVTEKTAELSFTQQGEVSARHSLTLYPAISGPIKEIFVQEGQHVNAGDPICTVDTYALSLQLQQRQAIIQSYKAQIAAGKKITQVGDRLAMQDMVIEQSRQLFTQAQTGLEQAKALYEGGVIAKSELDDAQTALTQSQLALDLAVQERKVIAASAEGESNEGYYLALIQGEESAVQQLEFNIEQSTLYAPIDGVISSLPASAVNYASSAAPLAQITGKGDLQVETHLSTRDVSSIQQGDPVVLVLERREGDLELPAAITRIDETAQPRLSALGVEERQVKVEIALSPDLVAQNTIAPGYRIDVRFLLYQQQGQLTVPTTALFTQEGEDMLFVVKHGKATAIPVVKGMQLRTETVIEQGLSAGDVVINDPSADGLKAGVRVTPDK